MLQSLIEGEREPTALAELAKQRLHKKIPELTEALTGRFSEHHGFLARLHLDVIDQHTTRDRRAHQPDRGGDHRFVVPAT